MTNANLFTELSQTEEALVSGGFLDFGSKKRSIKQKFNRIKQTTGDQLADNGSLIRGKTGDNNIGTSPRN